MRADVRSDGLRHSVSIGGTDMSAAVLAATIRLEAGEPGRLDLEVDLPVLELLDMPTRVVVSSDARDLLIAAGWTPPSDEVVAKYRPLRRGEAVTRRRGTTWQSV